MKQQKVMTGILYALTLAWMIAIPTALTRAQSTDQPVNTEQEAVRQGLINVSCDWLCQLRERQAQRLEGAWIVTGNAVVPPGVPQPPPFIAYGSFARGGASISSDRSRPGSKQHGTWAHIGANDFAGTAIEDLYDPMGNFVGTLKLRTRLTIISQDEYVGVSNAEFRDAAGNITRSVCGTFRGERIKIEQLPSQCQNVTPPQ